MQVSIREVQTVKCQKGILYMNSTFLKKAALKKQDEGSAAPITSLTEHPITVLLVDDQAMIGEAVRRMLSSETDIIFHYCSDPAQAIQIATEISPTVILQDLVMPDIDGLLLLRFFRANAATREVPIIMLSVKEEAKLKADAFSFGANDYLVKLPDQIELIARIRYHSKAYINILERNEAYQAMQKTQAQLVQAEKMSSLGQLVAGVGHEINNPVNFIYGNISHVSDYVKGLLKLLNLYQQRCPNPDAEIQELVEEIDLEFLVEDLPKVLASMKMGTDRIRQIVQTLRNFSRLDEAEVKPVNIHEGIDSTLVILQHRLRAKPERPAIEIIKEYGDLPEVECYAGQLNQVFMNILSNGIDALHARDSDRSLEEIKSNPSTITIRTQTRDFPGCCASRSWVRICIQDNGPGMSAAVRERLFEPFFTTKPVGSGTGLGLSISYQIVVDKHGGTIQCFSEPGKGAEFVIDIPMRQKKRELPSSTLQSRSHELIPIL